MAKTFKLSILKLDDVLFTGNVVSVILPGSEGEMSVLANHAPLITALKEGNITIRDKEDNIKTISVKYGVVKIGGNNVSILLEPLEKEFR